MFKNQLQELAQRSCFNLPSYTCIREGPDHAPRFKATVSFNGEVFESPGYHTTLRQAEHSAAEIALSKLSTRGPVQSLAARILDETGVCKNLLQETAQRAGVSLPVYTTIRSGPKHLPLFKCMVEVGGRRFMGDPAKTKKQAEKNAAMAAWSSLRQLPPASSSLPRVLENCAAGVEEASLILPAARSSANCKARAVKVRESRQRSSRDGQFVYASSEAACSTHDRNPNPNPNPNPSPRLSQFSTQVNSGCEASFDGSFDSGQRFLYNNPGPEEGSNHHFSGHRSTGRAFYNAQPSPGFYGGSTSRQINGRHQRRHSLSGLESPSVEVLPAGTPAVSRMMMAHPHRIRGLPYQSLSERFDLNRPLLLEELQLSREEEEDWPGCGDQISSCNVRGPHPQQQQQQPVHHLQPQQQQQQHHHHHHHHHHQLRNRMQSQSERFEYRGYLPQLDEEDCSDEWNVRNDLLASSYGMNGSLDREQAALAVDRTCGYSEGWLRGEALLQRLEEQKRHGYKEGWLRGDNSKQHNTVEEANRGRPWNVQNEEQKMGSLEEEMRMRLNNESHGNYAADGRMRLKENHGSYGSDGWYHQGEVNSNGDKERTPHGLDKKTVYSAVAAAAAAAVAASSSSSATPMGSSSSHFSSLWSKSAQWWGSHMPANTSSAAAAIASSLGLLRPSSNMAPAVRVRHMVPVCSAPPSRRIDSSNLPINHHGASDSSSSSSSTTLIMDSEAVTRQVFNKLRL